MPIGSGVCTANQTASCLGTGRIGRHFGTKGGGGEGGCFMRHGRQPMEGQVLNSTLRLPLNDISSRAFMQVCNSHPNPELRLSFDILPSTSNYGIIDPALPSSLSNHPSLRHLSERQDGLAGCWTRWGYWESTLVDWRKSHSCFLVASNPNVPRWTLASIDK